MASLLTRWLIGRPVANREAEDRKLGVLTGVPAMGLDERGNAGLLAAAALMVDDLLNVAVGISAGVGGSLCRSRKSPSNARLGLCHLPALV
jgi:hypothetical protein